MGLNTHGLVPMKLAYSPHVLSSVVVVHEVRMVCVYKTCPVYSVVVWWCPVCTVLVVLWWPVYSSGDVLVSCVYSSGGVVVACVQ